MRRSTHHLRPYAIFLGLLLAVGGVLPFPDFPPAPAAAQMTPGGSFGSAVPCLTATDTFAVTCAADTIVSNVPAGDPTLVGLTSAGKGTTYGTLVDTGAVYGVAYDDGNATGGTPRLFSAAYTKRLSAYGTLGAGGIYVTNLATNSTTPYTTIGGAGTLGGRTAVARDRNAIAAVGRTGLGDMEISPDGTTLFVTNLAARRIERVRISGATPQALSAIAIPFNLLDGNATAQADMIPFALEFYPDAANNSQLLLVGVTDTARRGARPLGQAPTALPRAFVLLYVVSAPAGDPTWTTGQWVRVLTQDLSDSGLGHPVNVNRFTGSSYGVTWDSTPTFRASGYQGWNPWRDNLAEMPWTSSSGGSGARTVFYPQPLLTDIELDHNGSLLWLGLRDRTGDQVYNANAPSGEYTTIAQGDTLAYRVSGGAWTLQTVSRNEVVNDRDPAARTAAAPSDYFNDNRHAYNPGPIPPHIENHMGGLASAVQGNPTTANDRLLTTSLLGGNEAGTIFFHESGGDRVGRVPLITGAVSTRGKATALGDAEWLCSYGLIAGVVWRDTDYDGIRDAGEPAFPNLTLEVFRGDVTSPALAQATTDANGAYTFAVPANQGFNVRIAQQEFFSGDAIGWRYTRANRGSDDTRDSEVNPLRGYMEFAAGSGSSGMALPLRMRESDERNINIGLTNRLPLGEVGNFVWSDTDSDGRQDSGEPGIPGVSVSLYRVSGFGSNTLAPALNSYPRTATTNASGDYRFINIEPGRYYVQFSPPAGYRATLRDVGSDTSDSDADGTTGWRTPQFDIGDVLPQSVNLDQDLGLVGDRGNLAISKIGPTQMNVGNTAAYGYRLNWSYTGNRAVSNVQVIDTLPAGITYLSANPAPSSVSGRTYTWNLGALNNDRSGTITIFIRAPASLTPTAAIQQDVTNTATIRTSTPGGDDDPRDDSSSTTTRLVRPEIRVQKRAPTTVLVGDEFSYEIQVTNSGSTPAVNVVVSDPIYALGLTFVRYEQTGGASCSRVGNDIRCSGGVLSNLAPGATYTLRFTVQATATTISPLVNTATATTSSSGDNPADNRSSTSTIVQFPNPGVGVSLTPAPFPVGTSGTLTVPYRNTGTGESRSTVLTIALSSGTYTLGSLPGGCSSNPTTRTITCDLGTLNSGASDQIVVPFTIPADFPADQIVATATITSSTPERVSDRADNSATTTVSVVRPNVYVEATGPSSIVGQGSVFPYVVDYGNVYRRNPSLTRAAENVVLTATLPNDVSYLDADVPPSSINGQVLTWDLNTLAPRASGRITILVQTDVPAGAVLTFETEITTTTPGDDPSDNRDTVITDVVQPPAIPEAGGALRLAIHSEFDPNSQDGNPTNGVYISDGGTIAWPAGEVLDFTPRLNDLDLGSAPWPYEYRARVTGWSLVGFQVNGTDYPATATDSRGRAGCRPGDTLADPQSILAGCRYRYLGGENLNAIASPQPIREEQIARQAHAYWTPTPGAADAR
ncbi:MAG: DUF11 domain-containing protein [Oscillochloris sp.]|nr:DUF11 domain-containing protein [Oscillochloris sp.]